MVLALVLTHLGVATTALACPLIGGFVDYNCDQVLKVAITGDSIVYGIGDDSLEDDGGGYVTRLKEYYPSMTIENLGVPGATSLQLFRAFKTNLTKEPPGVTRLKSMDADIYIIDVGRNDYWNRQSPELTVRNIRRLVRYLKETLTLQDGTSPLFVVSRLIPTSRAFQKPFVDGINKALVKQASTQLPAYLRFDTFNAKLLTSDGLHPSAEGYDALAKILKNHLIKSANKRMNAARADNDLDGVYDLFETIKFFTNPLKIDTDGDGLSDGLEIFTLGTSPLQ
jgi:lysophospholipase L1-like esterase